MATQPTENQLLAARIEEVKARTAMWTTLTACIEAMAKGIALAMLKEGR